MESDRVVFDTNVWISFLIGKQMQQLRPLLARRTVQFVVSVELLDELAEVVQRPKMARYFSASQAQELLNYLRVGGLLVAVASEVAVCRDPKDNFLLALAQDAEAAFLVTGDNDLLVLQTFGRTQIITPAAFGERFPAT